MEGACYGSSTIPTIAQCTIHKSAAVQEECCAAVAWIGLGLHPRAKPRQAALHPPFVQESSLKNYQNSNSNKIVLISTEQRN